MSNLPILYGITHDPRSKEVIARVPRSIKVAIGKPKGPAIHVLLVISPKTQEAGWQLEIGVPSKTVEVQKEWFTIDDTRKLEKRMEELMRTVPSRTRPEKLPYFSFYKDRGDGQLVHDLDSILLHGSRPTSIPIMFTDNTPFLGEYQWYGTKGKICWGNGLEATRLNANAITAEHKKLAEASTAAGLKHYHIDDGCFLTGCPMAGGNCSQAGILSFQLLEDMRLGSKAEITTHSRASLSQLYASLSELMVFIGGGNPNRANLRGLPLTLTMRPFRTNHNNIPGKAYKLAVEFRAGNLELMREKILQAAELFQLPEGRQSQIEGGTTKLIAAPSDIVVDAEEVKVENLPTVEGAEDESDVDEGITAAQNAAFMGDSDDEESEPDEEVEEAQKETVAEAAASVMAETEAKLRVAHAERLAKQQPAATEVEPVKPAEPVDDMGASRYETNKAAAPATTKLKFGAKKQ